MPNSVPSPFGDFAIIGSLAIMTQFSFRPMALRHQVSLILPFGGRSVLINCTTFMRMLILDALTLRRRLLAALLLSVVWLP
jgi:hypothetical protein